jgi:hypothetical protein
MENISNRRSLVNEKPNPARVARKAGLDQF